MDMTECIAPRSDQMNAEDLLTGPRTFTVAAVHKGASTEQPVDVALAEFPDDRPFKPSKTVRRLMVAAWGPDTASYVGKRMTLYRDPAVRFGGQDVGGIRVSHMSGIDKPLTIALTVTRGKRVPYTVKPLSDDAPAVQAISQQQSKALHASFNDAGITERVDRLLFCRDATGRDIETSADLTRDEAKVVLDLVKNPGYVEKWRAGSHGDGTLPVGDA
jgi:hypothetical protein